LDGQHAVIQTLIKKGADVNVIVGEASSLALSLPHKSSEVVQLLLDHGANPNAKLGRGWTVLHVATQRSLKEIVELVIEMGADTNAKDPMARQRCT
jgi:ankyrin repeat protein